MIVIAKLAVLGRFGLGWDMARQREVMDVLYIETAAFILRICFHCKVIYAKLSVYTAYLDC